MRNKKKKESGVGSQESGIFSESDRSWMERALGLAHKGGRTSPNPPVGAVIVKNGKIFASGYHRGPNTLHAEADALRQFKGKANGATLYVTLEPCCHTEKRTPPCVDAILKSGIRRVVIGTKDPNPLVDGRGMRLLRSKGLRVETGCLEEECAEIIRAYEKWITRKVPYVILKSAVSLDGKIATARGESHWITGEAARKKVHEIRSRVDAVMVGFQTALHDDPFLTVRLVKGPNPVRMILDSHLRLPANRKVFSNLKVNATWVATLRSQRKTPKVLTLQKKGVDLIFCPANRKGRVDLVFLFRELGKRGVTSVMVEGGAALSSALVESKNIDELWLFMAPKLLGGEALDLFSELQVPHLKSAPLFTVEEIQPLGEDLWIRLAFI